MDSPAYDDIIDDRSFVDQGLNLINQALSIFNTEMRLITCNRRFIEMFELPENLVLAGSTFADINMYLARRGEFGPGDPATLASERLERARLFEPHYFERTRPNGRRISVEGHPLSDKGWITIYSDITETWQNEQMLKSRDAELSDKLLVRTELLSATNRSLTSANRALQETKSALQASEDRMRSITSAIPAHIAYIDTRYIYRFSNNRFSDTMKIKRPGVTGRTMESIFPAQVFTKLRPKLDEAFGGQRTDVEYEMIDDEGNTQFLRTIFSPEIDEEGLTLGAFVLSLNVSAEKAATELQLQAKRMETTAQLTSGLAHDFSNILTVILGNLGRLADLSNDENSRLVSSTESAARRGTRIIDNLMALLYRQHLDVRETNVSKIMSDLATLFSASMSESIVVDLQIPDKDIIAMVDGGALQDAILNILFNARDAIESCSIEGRLGITASIIDSATSHCLQVSVTDSGAGFTAEALSSAIEPFFTTKPQGKGSGLGLAMVHGFLEECSGKLLLSNNADAGATVTINIPLSPLEPGLVRSQETADALHHQRVLIVDDDAELRALMRDHATELGLSVIEADSAEEAGLLLSRVDGIDALISDIIMPGDDNGLDLARQATSTRPALKVLLVSGLAVDNSLFQFANAEFPVLRKPFDKKTFSRQLVQLLSTSANPQ
ncbi:PAS-domain containing protein [Granulosicoccus antarcticus]|uniref:histidine kinase n=1 Tax=Granulosicoccus antarcticus IMCC3135 TaxID=1192854 RepID=A0A2Z2NXJ7_9GAMM|nr:PAS-domain containing protein [Granulosicoccus antarcticus]ASJ74478.1 Blue-light-activated protein [Granulosicoccus antarcticus IMCC3135]